MTTLAALVNGIPVGNDGLAISASDRGLQFGDGLFETMLLQDGAVQAFDDHLYRLELGCRRLSIEMPSTQTVETEIAALTQGRRHGIIKLIVTHGVGGRGYRRSAPSNQTRVLTLHEHAPQAGAVAVTLRWCETRMARSPTLAGVKHLNRLEQVLAQNEWHDASIGEGLMLDMEGEVIGGTMTNIFIVSEGVLCTPDLRYGGVRGVMRARVLRAAHQVGINVDERPVWPADITSASEVFVTNAIRGIRPAVALETHTWQIGATTRRLAAALGLW